MAGQIRDTRRAAPTQDRAWTASSVVLSPTAAAVEPSGPESRARCRSRAPAALAVERPPLCALERSEVYRLRYWARYPEVHPHPYHTPGPEWSPHDVSRASRIAGRVRRSRSLNSSAVRDGKSVTLSLASTHDRFTAHGVFMPIASELPDAAHIATHELHRHSGREDVAHQHIGHVVEPSGHREGAALVEAQKRGERR